MAGVFAFMQMVKNTMDTGKKMKSKEKGSCFINQEREFTGIGIREKEMVQLRFILPTVKYLRVCSNLISYMEKL